MTDEHFLQTILADPDNDGPRLIYADWLEERGDQRGEFIRVQCELAKGPANYARYGELKSREQALLQHHEHEWIEASIKRLVNSYEFQRGLPTFVELRAKQFSHFPRVASMLPVHHLRIKGPFQNRKPSTQTIAATPSLARLTSLELTDGYYYLGPQEVASLVASPHLRRLETLILARNAVGAEGLIEIASTPNLPSLRSLALWCYGVNPQDFVGDVGAQSLAQSSLLPQLTQLSLRANRITSAGCQALATTPAIANLTNLDLSHNPIEEDGIEALALSSYLGECALDLSGIRINWQMRDLLRDRFGHRVIVA